MLTQDHTSKKALTLEDIAASIADLTQVVSEGFHGLAVHMDERFGAVENRLDTVENRLDKMENSLDKVENRLDKIETRLDTVDTSISALNNSHQVLATKMENYLKLYDGRYLELKHRQDVLVKWVSLIAKHQHIDIDVKELEWG